MEKILRTTASICAGILIMLFIEGLLTFGAAFCFEKYNVFGWLLQGVILLLAISFSAWLSIKEDDKS
jgi:hypothetical protein